MELLYTLMRILFPDFCRQCGAYGSILCSNCAMTLKNASENVPPNCFAALSYRDTTTRSVILSLKTRENPSVANLIARRMHEASLEGISELIDTRNFDRPIIIPIPGSAEKLSNYGFNHAEVLAKAFATTISELKPTLNTTVLKKLPNKHKQALSESRKERFSNMQSAFSIDNRESVRDQCVIIIDDIITTGATCLTARQLLLNAGARQVICIAAAH